jgi:hypothetical protein
VSTIEPRERERDAVWVVWQRSTLAALVILLVAGGLATAPAAQAACNPQGPNAIAAENAQTQGVADRGDWDITGSGSASLQGFATEISVNCGSPVQFKITAANTYRLDIYRMGWYGGHGARKVATVTPTSVTNQGGCATDSTTGLTDCANWSVSATWNVPSDAVSGIYFAHVVSTAGPAAASHIVFVVRNDSSTSDLYFQTSDTTWQAYNPYGAGSLYTGGPTTGPLAGIGRSVKVSYNRPFTTRDQSPQDWVFNAEYPMVRWLERNGYDVSYATGVDSDARGALMLQHKTFLSVGHDEYWSGDQRANVEAARNAGKNLAFFSGNEVFWKTRWENSHRTLVTYKGTHGDAVDPTGAWTGTWRDPRSLNPEGARPENALTGTIFTVNAGTVTLQVPAAEGKLRLWRGTPVAGQSAGQTMPLGVDTIGYEWDEDVDNGARPAGLVELSSTTATGIQKLQDYGSIYGPGTATHHLTLYRDTNGAGPDALVFGAGTVQWSWGLDNDHDGGSAPADSSMQQATVNLMADMGAQPATPSGVSPATASTDTVAPSTSIASPADASAVPAGTSIIHGTAADTGGRVGAVEVSVDGGTTWHPANGRESWSYTWTPATTGRTTLLARAADDSANLGAAATVTVNVGTRGCPCSLLGDAPMAAASSDNQPTEVGMRFRADDDGFITALRYWGTGVSGTHVGRLWTSTGTKLAQATFASSALGWHQVALPVPVPVSAGATYISSYYASAGGYPEDQGFFNDPFDAPPLHAPANTGASPNGVYTYATNEADGGFPDQSFNASNYGSDVVFVHTDQTAPTVLSVAPADGAGAVGASTQVSATFDEALAASTLDGFTFQLRDGAGTAVPAAVAYNAPTRTAVLTPSTPLAGSARYSATVKGGAVGVSDLAGNPLAQDRTWSFTTAPGPTGGNESGAGSSTSGSGAGAHASHSAAAAALRVTVTPRRIRASSAGTVKLRVACPQRARSCKIKLRLRLGRRDVATKTLTVSGGHSKTFVLKLNATARRDLRRKGSLAVTAIAAVRDKAGKSATTRTSIRLLAPRRR